MSQGNLLNMPQGKRYRGKLIHWEPTKGFGFVSEFSGLGGFPDNSLFVHVSYLEFPPDELHLGMILEYSVAPSRQEGKCMATSVTAVPVPVTPVRSGKPGPQIVVARPSTTASTTVGATAISLKPALVRKPELSCAASKAKNPPGSQEPPKTSSSGKFLVSQKSVPGSAVVAGGASLPDKPGLCTPSESKKGKKKDKSSRTSLQEGHDAAVAPADSPDRAAEFDHPPAQAKASSTPRPAEDFSSGSSKTAHRTSLGLGGAATAPGVACSQAKAPHPPSPLCPLTESNPAVSPRADGVYDMEWPKSSSSTPPKSPVPRFVSPTESSTWPIRSVDRSSCAGSSMSCMAAASTPCCSPRASAEESWQCGTVVASSLVKLFILGDDMVTRVKFFLREGSGLPVQKYHEGTEVRFIQNPVNPQLAVRVEVIKEAEGVLFEEGVIVEIAKDGKKGFVTPNASPASKILFNKEDLWIKVPYLRTGDRVLFKTVKLGGNDIAVNIRVQVVASAPCPDNSPERPEWKPVSLKDNIFIKLSLLAVAFLPDEVLKYMLEMQCSKSEGFSDVQELKRYLDHTFRRLLVQDSAGGVKGCYAPRSADPHILVFNTNLLEKSTVEGYTEGEFFLYAVLESNSAKLEKGVPFILKRFLSSETARQTYKKGRYVNPLETLAHPDYVGNQNGLFDPKVSISESLINVKHMLEDIDRFGFEFRQEVERQRQEVNYAGKRGKAAEDEVRARVERLVRAAAMVALNRCRANPRMAVPQFFSDRNNPRGELQFLLPVNPVHKLGPPTCAVTVSPNTACGVITSWQLDTVLSLDMARCNARLVSRIDQQWLKTYVPTPASSRGPRFLPREEDNFSDDDNNDDDDDQPEE
eukprot:RCo024087